MYHQPDVELIVKEVAPVCVIAAAALLKLKSSVMPIVVTALNVSSLTTTLSTSTFPFELEIVRLVAPVCVIVVAALLKLMSPADVKSLLMPIVVTALNAPPVKLAVPSVTVPAVTAPDAVKLATPVTTPAATSIDSINTEPT